MSVLVGKSQNYLVCNDAAETLKCFPQNPKMSTVKLPVSCWTFMFVSFLTLHVFGSASFTCSSQIISSRSSASEKCLNNSNSNLSNVYFEIHTSSLGSPPLHVSFPPIHRFILAAPGALTICSADLK